jgi:N-acetylmuramoyl-L-alanine amidase
MRLRTALLVLVAPAAVLAAPVVLERLHLEAAGGDAILHLHLSAAATHIKRTLTHPDRIVIDLPGVQLGPETRTPRPGAGPVARVRTGQFDAVTARVVLDLARPATFEVRSSEARLEVRVGGSLAAPAEARTPLVAPPPASAPPATATPPPPAPAALPLIIIDPGHGGRDPGAAGVGGVLEKDVVLTLAYRVAETLNARLRVNTLLTRADDSTQPLDRRLPPAASPDTLFISLHANAHPTDSTLAGIEVFFSADGVRAASGGAAGGSEATRLADAVTGALRERGKFVRDPRPGRYAVLVRNPVPAILVEIGYLTHPGDAARAQDPGYQQALSDALADGLAAYLRPPGSSL